MSGRNNTGASAAPPLARKENIERLLVLAMTKDPGCLKHKDPKYIEQYARSLSRIIIDLPAEEGGGQ